MRIITEGNCTAEEKQVEFTGTVMGNKIKACVSTKKQLFILKNVTHYHGMHCVIQPYSKNPSSELDIFNEYNFFGKEKGETTFIEYHDDNGDMKIGFGTGALLGGIDKELTIRAVDKKTLEKVAALAKDKDHIEDIRNTHNFLYGDSNTEMMESATKMEHELKKKWEELTGWRC